MSNQQKILVFLKEDGDFYWFFFYFLATVEVPKHLVSPPKISFSEIRSRVSFIYVCLKFHFV